MGGKGIIVTVDLGTTNCKSVAINHDGEVIASASEEVSLISPREGWYQQDPNEVFNKMIRAIRRVAKKLDNPEDVKLLGFSSQLHGVLILDHEDKVICPLIPWLDTRSTKECEAIRRKIDSYEIYKRTGCRISCQYVLPKVMWFRNRYPEKSGEICKIFSPKDYAIYMLSGISVTDYSIASGTQLFNLSKMDWDEELLSLAGISRGVLPDIVSGEKIVGEVKPEISEAMGLHKGIEIIVGVGDAQAQTLGLGVTKTGKASCNIGTSSALRVASNKLIIDKSHECRFFAYMIIPGLWMLGGAAGTTGAVLRWFRDNFGACEMELSKFLNMSPYEIMDLEAQRSQAGSSNLIFIPYFTGMMYPYANPNIKGALIGLSLSHKRADIVRSVMEGAAFSVKLILQVLEEQEIKIDEIRLGGGGARSRIWPQIFADVLGKKIFITHTQENTALGIAILGLRNLRPSKNIDEIAEEIVRPVKCYTPNEKHRRVYERGFELFKEYCKIFGGYSP